MPWEQMCCYSIFFSFCIIRLVNLGHVFLNFSYFLKSFPHVFLFWLLLDLVSIKLISCIPKLEVIGFNGNMQIISKVCGGHFYLSKSLIKCLFKLYEILKLFDLSGQVFLFTFYCPFVPDYMKPDTETYNWVIQAYTRAESYDR